MTDLLAGLRLKDRIVAVQVANRLLAALPDGLEKAAAERLRRTLLPDRGKTGTSQLRIGTHPLAAMLLQSPATTLPLFSQREWLRGWVLAGALRFCDAFGETDRFSRVSAGLRAARLMAIGGYRHDLMSELPTFEGVLGRLILAVRQLAAAQEQRGVTLVAQLRQLELLLRDAEGPVVPRHVDPFRRRVNDVDMILPEQQVEEDGVTIHRAAGQEMRSDSAPEDRAEQLRDRLYDFGATYRALSPPVARAQAQLELLEMDRSGVGWQAEFAALTPTEARRTFTAALADARRGDIGARLVLASLVSGRAVATLSAIRPRPLAGQSWREEGGGIAFAPDVRGLGHPSQGGFVLRPPPDLTGWLDATLAPDQAEDCARAWLSRLDQGPRSLRLSRIARALRDGILAQGEDGAIAAMLSGQSCSACIPLYYARFPVLRLRQVWLRYLTERLGAGARGNLAEGFRLEPLNPRRRTIGSVLIPEPRAVSAWFRRMVLAVEAARARQGQGIDYLVDRLAVEANLAASVLCFQTARRPHLQAFEPLSQITGRSRPRVRLAGKGGRQVDDGRWIPLGAACVQALQLWQATLDAVEASGLAGGNPALGRMICDVRAGRAPLFFQWDNLEAAPQPMSAAALFERVGAPELAADPARSAAAHAVDNWARYFMRSALAAEGLQGTLLDGYLGHGGAVADPMAPASGFAAADQDPLRAAMDAIWDGLEISLPAPMPIP